MSYVLCVVCNQLFDVVICNVFLLWFCNKTQNGRCSINIAVVA